MSTITVDASYLADTHYNLFTKQAWFLRFICDLVKDTQVKDTAYDVERCKEAISDIYEIDQSPGSTDIHLDFHKRNHLALLDELEKVLDNPAIKMHVTEYKNVIKTSTVGSNTHISTAKYVFYESGLKPDSVCAVSPDKIRIILTPGAIMDPMGKGIHNAFFPTTGTNIKITEEFTSALGFKNTTWEYNGSNKTIKIGYSNDSEISYIFTNPEGNTDYYSKQLLQGSLAFGEFVKGNLEKNKLLSDYHAKRATAAAAAASPHSAGAIARDRMVKLFETKELGDVAQVWLYLAFVKTASINDKKIEPEEVLMITTDKVVYLFCALLNLSCIYTGARA